jgi:hypothetical protein
MSSARLIVLGAILAIPVLFAGASKAPAGEADRIEARIEIFGFAGLHVLTNRTTIEEAGDRYSIAMDPRHPRARERVRRSDEPL